MRSVHKRLSYRSESCGRMHFAIYQNVFLSSLPDICPLVIRFTRPSRHFLLQRKSCIIRNNSATFTHRSLARASSTCWHGKAHASVFKVQCQLSGCSSLPGKAPTRRPTPAAGDYSLTCQLYMLPIGASSSSCKVHAPCTLYRSKRNATRESRRQSHGALLKFRLVTTRR